MAAGLLKGLNGIAQPQQAGAVSFLVGGQHPEFLHGCFVLGFGGQVHDLESSFVERKMPSIG